MDRKAQYYLVVVVILCIVIFSYLSISTVTPRLRRGNFQKLWENCYTESTYVVNQAVKSQENLFTETKNFAGDFKEYSKTIDSDFGFITVVTNSTGSTRITNLLESNVTVMADSEGLSGTVAQESYSTDETDYVQLTVNAIQYDFNTTKAPNIQFLFWESKQGVVRVKQT
jgi:hypothetical protein